MHPFNFSASKSCCCEERTSSRRLPRRRISGLLPKSKTRSYAIVLLLFLAFGVVYRVLPSLSRPTEPVRGRPGCWTEDLNKMAAAYPCSDTSSSAPKHSAQVRLCGPKQLVIRCSLLLNPRRDATSKSSCVRVHAERKCKQVALMFLVRDQIPTEPIWTAFIAAAAELSLRHPVPPTAPADPEFLPSSREATGESPKCRGRYLPPVREVEPAGAFPSCP